MKKGIKNTFIDIAKQKISSEDPSHDIGHSLRVLANAEIIGKKEKADMEIIIPSAIFHDIVNYAKNDPRAKFHAQESADETVKILNSITDYPKNKISAVDYSIRMHSSRTMPDTLEAKIIQDADNLEVTGAIIIMRMFASAGFMGRAFYHLDDPWWKKRELDGLKWTLDYYLERLLEVEKKMNTSTGKLYSNSFIILV